MLISSPKLWRTFYYYPRLDITRAPPSIDSLRTSCYRGGTPRGPVREGKLVVNLSRISHKFPKKFNSSFLRFRRFIKDNNLWFFIFHGFIFVNASFPLRFQFLHTSQILVKFTPPKNWKIKMQARGGSPFTAPLSKTNSITASHTGIEKSRNFLNPSTICQIGHKFLQKSVGFIEMELNAGRGACWLWRIRARIPTAPSSTSSSSRHTTWWEFVKFVQFSHFCHNSSCLSLLLLSSSN